MEGSAVSFLKKDEVGKNVVVRKSFDHRQGNSSRRRCAGFDLPFLSFWVPGRMKRKRTEQDGDQKENAGVDLSHMNSFNRAKLPGQKAEGNDMVYELAKGRRKCK
jgi:hypothetical protein